VDLAGTHSVNTVYGPNDSFWTSSEEGYSWQNLPEALEEYILQQLTPKGWKSKPLQVALGVEKTYVARFSDGVISYDLAGYYDDLIKIIEAQWRDIVVSYTWLFLYSFLNIFIHINYKLTPVIVCRFEPIRSR